MKLLYGTTNAAKAQAMGEYLADLGIEILTPQNLDIVVPFISETGGNPLENARIKALAYHGAAGIPVFSCDSSLYIEGLDEKLQPGVHVRNVDGRILSDEQMIDHYSMLARRCGGFCTARYINAICLILNDHSRIEEMGDDLSGEKFLIVSKPHSMRKKGFPLDSLSVHIESGKYYFDLDKPRITSTAQGFRTFFIKALNLSR